MTEDGVPQRLRGAPRWTHAAGLYLATFTVYAISPVKVQSDSIWSIPTAVSILDQGNTDLDEYRGTFGEQKYGIYEINGHAYNYFPLGPSLVAVPLLFAFDRFVQVTEPISARLPKLKAAVDRWQRFHAVGKVDLGFYDTIELIIASLLVSGAAVLVFLTARRQASALTALIATFVFALCTSAYSTASRVLWQHSPSVLAISAIVFLLAWPIRSWRGAIVIGALIGMAYQFRPTNSISVILVMGYFLLSSPKLLPFVLLGGLAVGLPFCAYNLSIYGALLPPYFHPERIATGGAAFAEALAGNLVSPARGLFIYSPVFLLSAYSVWRRLRRGELTPLEKLSTLAVCLHWFAISAFAHWWGGHSFGPRFFVDVTPYLVYLMIPVVEQVVTSPRRGALAAALVLTVGLSFFVHLRGATSWATHGWNDGPVDVDVAPSRLWDWRDLSFLRGLTAEH